MDDATSIDYLREQVKDFVAERDWEQFHTPKNLAISIAVEAAELLEIFQWSEDNEPLDEEKQKQLYDELADVLIYCFAAANALDIDISSAVKSKIEKNAHKYPVERFRGRYK